LTSSSFLDSDHRLSDDYPTTFTANSTICNVNNNNNNNNNDDDAKLSNEPTLTDVKDDAASFDGVDGVNQVSTL
jgi:hypothetical protein